MDVIVRQLAGLAKPKGRCSMQPHAALAMSAEELEAYVRRCFTVWHFAYAAQSVPTFQLAYFLATFPNATWTFLDYRRLYGNNSRDVLSQLAQRLGLRLQNFTKACDFHKQREKRFTSSGGIQPRFNRTRLDALFAPWRHALMALIERSGAMIL